MRFLLFYKDCFLLYLILYNTLLSSIVSAEDGMVHDDFLLKRMMMTDLCSESAKLKSLGAMEMIPTDKLVRLLNLLEINIRGGDRVSPITDVSCHLVIFCVSFYFENFRRTTKASGRCGWKEPWIE